MTSSAPKPKRDPRIVWIIESNEFDEPGYLSCDLHEPWSADPRRAIRYARLEDAERVIAFDFPYGGIRAVEFVEEWLEDTK